MLEIMTVETGLFKLAISIKEKSSDTTVAIFEIQEYSFRSYSTKNCRVLHVLEVFH